MLNEAGKPVVGTDDNMLGARVPIDIEPDNDANRSVHPDRGEKGGISVNKNWRKLPPALIPERLKEKRPGARGSETFLLFRFADVEFESGPLADKLFLRWGQRYHGAIEPTDIMPLADYQTALAATRDQWCNAETDV